MVFKFMHYGLWIMRYGFYTDYDLFVQFRYVCMNVRKKENFIRNLNGIDINGLISYAKICSLIGMGFKAQQIWY